jgi:hypothetical protein
VNFDALYTAKAWKPIRGCPGRYGLADGAVRESPAALVTGATPQEFRVAAARDVVVVTPFAAGGGLISYRRADGTYLHTLNTSDGFVRKLVQLGIQLG